MTELPPIPVGALTDGEAALLRAWAENYACAAVEAEREARHIAYLEGYEHGKAAERWFCARLCEEAASRVPNDTDSEAWSDEFELLAALIRQRGKQ